MSQIFHHSHNTLAKVNLVLAAFLLVILGWAFGELNGSSYITQQNVAREQPVPFSHAHHVGGLGLDCRYCHNTVERSPHAAVPPTQTCMNCHSQVKTDSPRLGMVRASFETGEAIPWVKVHILPDYVYFDHRPHLAAGVGCASCHGRIDNMVVVEQHAPLSMGWCLDCHRNPDPNYRPIDQITNMYWDESPEKATYDFTKDPERTRLPSPPVHCSGP